MLRRSFRSTVLIWYPRAIDEGVHCSAYRFSTTCELVFHVLLPLFSSPYLSIQVHEMKKHLERKVKAGKSKPKLKDMDPNVLPSAWSILRWCVASCTAHLEEITSPEERVQNLGE